MGIIWEMNNATKILHFRTLLEVARTGSFTLAASHLEMSQPTVSRLISQLEMQLGHPLLKRNANALTLTDAGKLVLRQARIILQASGRISTALAQLGTLEHGELRVGVPVISSNLFFTKVRQFKAQYPEIGLILVEEGSVPITTALLNEQIDFAILPFPCEEPRLAQRPPIEDRLGLIAPKNSRFSGLTEIHLSDLKNESFIFLGPTYVLNKRVIDACQQQGFTPKVSARSNQINVIADMVRAGMGIALLPQIELQRVDPRDLVICSSLQPAIPFNTALTWKADADLSYAASVWLSMVETAHEAGG